MSECVLEMRDLDGNIYEILEKPGVNYADYHRNADGTGNVVSYTNGFLKSHWLRFRLEFIEKSEKGPKNIKDKIVHIEFLDGVKKLDCISYSLPNLKSAVIPQSVTDFEENIFGILYSLDYVFIENNPIAEEYIKKNYPDVKIIKDRSLYNYLIDNPEPQKSLEFEVTLKSGETKKATLEPSEFSIGMKNWKMLWIQDMEKIFQKMGLEDQDKSNIKALKIPEDIRALGTALFWDTKNLETLILPESLNSINANVVAATKIKSLTLPDNIRFDLNKENSPFYSLNNQLKNVTVKKGSPAEEYIKKHHPEINISYKDDKEKLKQQVLDTAKIQNNSETRLTYVANPPISNLPVRQKSLRSYSKIITIQLVLLLIFVFPVGFIFLAIRVYNKYNYDKRIEKENKKLLLAHESECETTGESQNRKSVKVLKKGVQTLETGEKQPKISDEFGSTVRHEVRG